MIGERRGLGGSFRQGLLAYETVNTINKARRMPVISVLSSKIGLTMVSLKRFGGADMSRGFDNASGSK